MLLSVAVVCVGWVTGTSSLGGIDGMSPHPAMGKGQGDKEQVLTEVPLLQGNLSWP